MPYYSYGYGYDSANLVYLILLVPVLLLSLYAQAAVSGNFSRYSKVTNRRGLTGAQAAQRILHHAVPNRIIDTLQMSRSMYPQYNRHRLVDLIQRFDIADVEEHRALSDAEQTQMCFEYMRDEQRRRDC